MTTHKTLFKPALTAVLAVMVVFLVARLAAPAAAAPHLQPTPFPTPTPGPDGRILYTVQLEDTLFRISAISGVSVDEIRTLNNLGANDVISVGQQLLLGLAGPAVFTATPGPTFTPPPSAATPTPGIGTAMLCILLFEDQNGDALRQEAEPSIPAGAVSITARDGQTSLTAETQAGTEPDCFEDLPQGDYNITVAAPEGYNPTTLMNYPLSLAGGDETYLDFGAQLNADMLAEEAAAQADTPQRSAPIFGIFGAILILAGIGLAFYASRLRQ